ncbi:MAG: membrane integrity-associated transporter subunit PqiC [Betaproteobacteria bacterium]|nr:membrane integrity-associated transporter subunit PqiC [Betaproteobacteria bacterium]
MTPATRRMVLLAALAAAASGCVGGRSPLAERHDLGSVEKGGSVPALPLSAIVVRAPSWLESSAMQYRLPENQGTRRGTYREIRWAAPADELFGHALRVALLPGGERAIGARGCALRVDLDEFIQRFDSALVSLGVIEVRVAVLAPGSGAVLAHRSFRAETLAATPDARGGAVALRASTLSLMVQLRQWLDEIAREAGSPFGPARGCAGP